MLRLECSCSLIRALRSPPPKQLRHLGLMCLKMNSNNPGLHDLGSFYSRHSFSSSWLECSQKGESLPILQVQHLGRSIGNKSIVTDVSFDVNAGELLAIVGPSGAGKSSLLRLLNRLDEPTSGTVLLEDRDYRRIPTRDLRRRLGMVMQRPFVFPGTVADNLRFGPAQHGRALSEEEIEQLLRGVGLVGYAGEHVSHLSGGEAQRVCFARALANHPAILLLDEPTSSLDEAAKL